MKTKSAKAKARRLQDWVCERLQKIGVEAKSAIMGERGVDVQINDPKFPYKIECKNDQHISIWRAYKQACNHDGDKEPLVIMKKNHHKALAVVDAEYFMEMHNDLQKTKVGSGAAS